MLAGEPTSPEELVSLFLHGVGGNPAVGGSAC